jgi:uncharacterized protein (TIGR02452 family)
MREKNLKIFEENTKFFGDGIFRNSPHTISYKNSPKTKYKSSNFNIEVRNCGSFSPINEFENCCVLNFASAVHAGGGYIRGAQAQEECLCRQSDLYEELKLQEDFYNYHNQNKSELHSDWMLYTKNVTVFRDEFYYLVEPKTCSVITAAAPRNVPGKTKFEDIEKCFYSRIEKILTICQHHNHKNIVLGAWGCGVFRNSPNHVSRYFKEILDKGWDFENVIFAVYDNSKDLENLNSFKRRFCEN